MKKLFIIFYGIFYMISYAQLSINNSNPQAVFHIDGAKDNALTGSPTTAQQLNDFVVTETGNTGIGKTSPQRKLDVEANNQPLHIQNLSRQTPADHNILVRDRINGDVTSAKYSYSTSTISIPSGSSEIITIPSTINIPTGMLIIRAGNACGRTMISTYIYYGLSLAYQSSVARDKIGVAMSSSGGTGASLLWTVDFPNVLGCADGGNGSQFDYNIVKTANNTYKITNNGNIAKSYSLTVLRL